MILQNIIFPDICDETKELYFRDKKIIKKNIDRYEEINIISFDTYFNSFPIQKWYTYTDIDKINISLTACGSFSINLYYIKATGEIIFIKDHVFELSKKETILIDIPNISEACIVFFEIEKTKSFVFIEGAYTSNITHQKNVKISAVFCTCHREKFIKKNVQKFIDLRNKYKELENSFKLYVIDNGNTLSQEDFKGTDIELYHNLNTGGSGGFARGIIEILEKKDDTSHVLLMDDDVEINTESIFRLVAFASAISNRHEQSIIGGAMLDLFKKNIQSASIETWDYDTFTLKTHLNNINLVFIENILKNCLYSNLQNQYHAWWFCCIPISVVKDNGLPFPFFLKCDDIEYSLRNKTPIITCNGICVWHQPFYAKSTALSEYYDNKSTYLFLMLYSKKYVIYCKNIFRITKKFFCFLLIFNYNFALTMCEMLESLNAGLEEIKNVDKLSIRLNKIFSLNDKYIFDMEYVFSRYKNEKVNIFKKILFIITLNGHIFPSSFFIKNGISSATKISFMDYFFKKKMYIYNRYENTYTERTRSTLLFWKISLRFIILLIENIIKYKRLKYELKNNFTYLTSKTFWKKYLKIDN